MHHGIIVVSVGDGVSVSVGTHIQTAEREEIPRDRARLCMH